MSASRLATALSISNAHRNAPPLPFIAADDAFFHARRRRNAAPGEMQCGRVTAELLTDFALVNFSLVAGIHEYRLFIARGHRIF